MVNKVRKLRITKEELEAEGIYKMTLQEYAEWAICGKPLKDLTEKEIRDIGSRIAIPKKRSGFKTLPRDAPLDELAELIKAAIDDRIWFYEQAEDFPCVPKWIAAQNRARELGLLDE